MLSGAVSECRSNRCGVIAAQDLADRIAAMLTKLIRSAEGQQR